MIEDLLAQPGAILMVLLLVSAALAARRRPAGPGQPGPDDYGAFVDDADDPDNWSTGSADPLPELLDDYEPVVVGDRKDIGVLEFLGLLALALIIISELVR